MFLIANPLFDKEKEKYSFRYNNKDYELTNVNLYAASAPRYKFKFPAAGFEHDRFGLVAEGNYPSIDINIITQVAFVILHQIGTENYYALQRDEFRVEFCES